MISISKHYTDILLAIVCIAVAALSGCDSKPSKPSVGLTTQWALTDLAQFITNEVLYHDLKPFVLPEGNIQALEQWLASQLDDPLATGRLGRGLALVEQSDQSLPKLVDEWGQALVFKCPSSSATTVFHLYSIGSNGVDEMGLGDDIDASVHYHQIRHAFVDKNIDANVYVENKGHFRRIQLPDSTMNTHIKETSKSDHGPDTN